MTEQHFESYPAVSEEERSKTLQELEGQDWGDSDFPSYLVRTCHALRRKPLRDFTVEDLRIMIGQNIGLNYLMPLAIEHVNYKIRCRPFSLTACRIQLSSCLETDHLL
jgi:hypothetical protein